MEADEKKCPACAEVIKVDAKICKHCGVNLLTGRMPGASAPEPTKKGRFAKGCLIVVGVFVGLSILGSLLSHGSDSSISNATDGNGESKSEVEPAMEVTAEEVESAYDANEAAAQQQYGGRRLKVSGVIKSIDLGISDKPFLVLQGSNMFSGPQADLSADSQSKASSLSKGQSISLECTGVSEVIGTPMFKNCSF